MGNSERTAQVLTLEQLSERRAKTETISQYFQKQLKGYLETLRPLLAPAKLLGRYAGSSAKEDFVGAEKVVAQLQQTYQEVCKKPFGLQPEFDEGALTVIDNRIELYPWEYSFEVGTETERRTLTITSPVRWIMAYASGYTLSQLRPILAGKGERQPTTIRQFVVNALVMNLLLAKYPGITQLLSDLRYQAHPDKCPGLGELPVVAISACLSSFRPPDDLILAATRLSGIPAFIELIDVDAVHGLQDPIKERIQQMLR